MRRYINRVITGAGLLALLAAAGFAQSQPAQQPRGQGDLPPVMGRVGRRQMGRQGGGREHAERRVLGRLNLSDAQREQLRGIESRYAAGFRVRREELRSIRQSRGQGGALTAEQQARASQIREELRADAGKMREEIRALLTEEQRTQLRATRDELRRGRQERRQAREERRERRRQRRGVPPSANGQP